MTRVTGWLSLLVLCAACGESPPPPPAEGGGSSSGSQPPFEPPVVTNAEPPVRYPIGAFQQNTEGTVILRLFVDSLGQVRPESTRVAESSGSTVLDSAARAGVPAMRFAPAKRNGRPVSTAFLQPVHFRRPERTTATPQP